MAQQPKRIPTIKVAEYKKENEWIKYIETPLQRWYGIEDKVIYPHILVIIIILLIAGIIILR